MTKMTKQQAVIGNTDMVVVRFFNEAGRAIPSATAILRHAAVEKHKALVAGTHGTITEEIWVK